MFIYIANDMRDMPFCSLDEAWGNAQDSRPSVFDNEQTYDDTNVPSREVVNMSENPLVLPKSKPKTPVERAVLDERPNKIGRLCELLMSHLETCPSCRRNLEQRFGSKPTMPGPLETFAPYKSTPNYVEILMVILVGIFVIIMMDSFLKLGKKLA